MLSLVSMSAVAQPKAAVELLVGQADQETEFEGVSLVSGDDVSLGLRGAFEFNENLALEVSYMAYGEADDSFVDDFGDTITNEVETSALKVGLKGILPVANGFALVGRLGVARWDYEVTTKDSAFPGESEKLDDNGVDIFYGVGAQYSVTENFRVGLEYTILDTEVELLGEDVDHEIKNLALSVAFSF